MDIVDLHCDLLAYLALNPSREPFNPIVRCSAPQLKAGGVKLQTLAIGTESNIYSLQFGLAQLEIFLNLTKKYPNDFTESNILPAFENASGFAMEDEPIEDVFERLEWILTQITPLYIGITWNGENRFGGGCGSSSGLKADGKELLKFLSGRGIAIDFAHATDNLAREVLNCIDKEGLDVPVMASHSNFRAVVENIRNLPDDIASEIINREGLIGLVFYSKFLQDPKTLYTMIEHGLSLGGENNLAFGADFFCLDDLTSLLVHNGGFFEEMSDSSKYPSVIQGIKDHMDLPTSQIEAIASKNAFNFINKRFNLIK